MQESIEHEAGSPTEGMLIVGKQSPDHMALAPSFLTICEENIKGDDMEKIEKVCVPNGRNWKKQCQRQTKWKGGIKQRLQWGTLFTHGVGCISFFLLSFYVQQIYMKNTIGFFIL